MSADIVKDAERIVWWWETMYIAAASRYDPNHYVNDFTGAVRGFRSAKVEGDGKAIAEAALKVLGEYDACIHEGFIVDTDKALNAFQYQKQTAENRLEEIDELKAEHKKAITEWQKKYDELLEQYGVMKGRYEEVSERLDRLLKGQRPER